MKCNKCNCRTTFIPTGFRKFGENQRYKCSKCHTELKPKRFFGLFLLVLSISILLLLPNVIALSTTGTVDWNSNVGQIRSDFYGTNVHIEWLIPQTNIDKNNDGTTEAISNYTWHQIAFNNSNMKTIRLDAKIENYYSNQTTLTNGVNLTGNLTKLKDYVTFIHNNNLTGIINLAYMPTWLADNKTGYCNNGKSCLPYNYTIWQNIIVNEINNITSGGTKISNLMVEIWNEPNCGTSFLNNMSDTNDTRHQKYVELYNYTYTALKTAFPTLRVGGGAMSFECSGASFNGKFWDDFMQNSSGFDFISYHDYEDDSQGEKTMDVLFDARQNFIIPYCSKWSKTCNNIYITEFNYRNATAMNTSAQNAFMQIGTAYTSLLRNWSTTTSALVYQWSNQYHYGSFADEYPQLWAMVSEPDLDNKYYPPYNITKLFATNHKALNYVVTSSVADSTVKIVASKDSNGQKYITLTNTNSSGAFNITLTGMTSGLRDVETNQIYPNNAGTVVINDIASYGVKTLTSTSYPQISFVSPTPSNGSTVNTRNVIINATIDTENPLSSIIYNWNNTNYSIYDGNILLKYNLNNISSLGDNITFVTDSSKYGFNGTLVGIENITYTQGNNGLGLKFAGGQNNYINLNYPSEMQNMTRFTITMDVNMGLANKDDSRLLTHNFANYGSMDWIREGFLNKTLFRIVGLTGTQCSVRSNVQAQDQWDRLTVTYNGTSLILYQDGLLVQESVCSANVQNIILNGTGTLRFGDTGSGRYFNGSLDEIEIRNESLTYDQVKFLHRNYLNKDNRTRYISIYNTTIIGTNFNNYQIYANDNYNNNNQTNNQFIRHLTTVTLNMNNAKIINNYFYGAITGGINFFGGNDTTYGWTIGSNYNNATWNKQKAEDSKTMYYRTDMNLGHYYTCNTTNNQFNINSTYGCSYTGADANAYNHNISIDSMKWITETGRKQMYIPIYLPNGLMDNSSGQCLLNGNCPPTNVTTWINMAIDWINKTTQGNITRQNSIDIECWNEPDQNTFFMGKLGDDNINKFYNFSVMYNECYNKIKTFNPNIRVGGAGASSYYATNMWNGFLSNFSNKMDFVSFHTYDSPAIYQNMYLDISNEINRIVTLCNQYNANCSTIIVSEWNNENTTIKNTTSNWQEYQMNTAGGIIAMLNYNSTKLQSVFTRWGTQTNYTSGHLYDMTSQPILGNTLYPPYWVYSNFTRYGVGIIYNSSSNFDKILPVYSIKQNADNIIIANSENDKQNITLSCGSFTGNLIDVSSGELYSCASGSVNLGVTDEYEVRYLTEPVEQNGWYYNYLNEPLFAISGYSIGSTCNDTTISFYQIILNLSGLAIIAVVLYLIFKDGWEDITIQQMLIAGIAIIVGVVLFQQSADNLGIASCP